jgi:DNA polymerase/3'-5' exonuclease PolX
MMPPFEKQEIEPVDPDAEEPTRPKFPRTIAIYVAEQLHLAFQHRYMDGRDVVHAFEQIKVVGSTRRGKAQVKDLELLYIPRLVKIRNPESLLAEDITISGMNHQLDRLVAEGILAKRPNKNGVNAWGESIRLAIHVETGLPVDFFACTRDTWFNQLVCRTGGAKSNLNIAVSARAKGLKWNPFGKGFTNVATGQLARTVRSERDAFEIAGLPYLEPHQRP